MVELYYPCSENKGADQLCSYCAFVFAQAKIRLSHDAAYIILNFDVEILIVLFKNHDQLWSQQTFNISSFV